MFERRESLPRTTNRMLVPVATPSGTNDALSVPSAQTVVVLSNSLPERNRVSVEPGNSNPSRCIGFKQLYARSTKNSNRMGRDVAACLASTLRQ